jgi:1-acyl-sn-glycerol-3-phosphate acyltransferase
MASISAPNPAARRFASRASSVSKIALATFSSYLLGYFLTAFGALLGCGAALVGWQAFIRTGTVVWAHVIFLLAGRRLHFHGRENIEPGAAYLVVSNHASLYDIPAVMAAVPGVALMGRDYLMRIPGFGRLLRILHYVPIDPTSARKAREALDQAARTVRDGTSLGIFAEGTRTETGEVQPLKRGFVHVLRAGGCDLLPVSVRGTFALKPKGSLVMNPRERIDVFVGAPLRHERLAGLSDNEVMEVVRATLDELHRSRDETR